MAVSPVSQVPQTLSNTPQGCPKSEMEVSPLSVPPSLSDFNLDILTKIFSEPSFHEPRQVGSVSFTPAPKIAESVLRVLEDIQFFDPSVTASKELNGDEIAEAFQAEAVFTMATAKKPVVATYGAGPCIAVGGYEATNKIAFIVHFSQAGEVREFGRAILSHIAKLAKKKIEKPIQLHLRGGITGRSEALVKAIKQWVKEKGNLAMEIASEDILGRLSIEDILRRVGADRRSLSIDSRTGEVTAYDPAANPKRRELSESEMQFALNSARQPEIRVAYVPEE